MSQETYTINEASSKMNLTPFYVRKCIREGKLDSTLEQIGDTKVHRHIITLEELERFENRPKKQVGKREDGRNKYTIYLNLGEFETLVEQHPDLLIGRSNVKKSE